MQRIFLYRLFKKARLFFLFAMLFILSYVVVLYKQMDMLLFPINSMFSATAAKDFSTFTYALKLNDSIVKITDEPYVKKDFSENALQNFSKWIMADRADLMTSLIDRRISDSTKRKYYLKKLTAPENTLRTWPVWFAQFNHVPVTAGDKIEIWKYLFYFNENKFVLTDSLLITQQTVANE